MALSIKAAERICSERLWHFSLAYYPQVKDLCLRWQDNYHANVNIILALCYAECLGWQVNTATLNNAIAQLAPVNRQLTQVVRGCRRQLAQLALEQELQEQLKQSLLSTELLAEQVEQTLLSRDLTFIQVKAPDNLSLYLKQLCIPVSATIADDLIDLRQASASLPVKAP